ncbi:hypothetical protein NM688_g1792 [Phlebia brevispora]|uniref:Uncharacterized protein n=1 Tax=Phlebia brevispora TaxID=194682 RepID=A0ACC1TAP3_9APHY|nr:hypothetical protein NM688_g1792 [Phlebia brevispora]
MSAEYEWDLDSELTELTDEEEEYKPKKAAPSKAAKLKEANKEYKIGVVMRPPRTTSYSADWVFTQMNERLIELEPSYQRDIVWPETKQIGLVDSLLRNYYIPPIIFAVRTSAEGHERRICIDGKQRLTSIRRFMDGEIYHKDGNKRYWYKQTSKGSRKAMLPDQYCQAFRNKQIVCVEFDELNEDQEREIFQRVQLGVPLTPAERMQAICGPWPDLVREVQDTILGDDGFGENFEWDRTRGREFQCLSSVIYLIVNSSNSKAGFPGTPQLEKMLQKATPVPPSTRDCILQTFRIYEMLARDPALSICFQTPRVSPLEFIMTGALIFMRRGSLSLTQLSSAITLMRADVRSKHNDVRQNNKTSKTMWSFIKKVKSQQLESDGQGDIPAATFLKQQPLPKAPKRKRSEDVEDPRKPVRRRVEDEDEEPRKPVKSPIEDEDEDEEPRKPAKRNTGSLDTQKARRSNIKSTPTKASSSSGIRAKKPPILATSSASSGRSGTHSGRGGAKELTESPPNRKRVLSTNSARVKAEGSSRRARATSSRGASSPIDSAATLSAISSGPTDRLAAIRAAKAKVANALSSKVTESFQSSAVNPAKTSTLGLPQQPLACGEGGRRSSSIHHNSDMSLSSSQNVDLDHADGGTMRLTPPISAPGSSSTGRRPSACATEQIIGASSGPLKQIAKTPVVGTEITDQIPDPAPAYPTPPPNGDPPPSAADAQNASTSTVEYFTLPTGPRAPSLSMSSDQSNVLNRQATLSPTLPQKPLLGDSSRGPPRSKTILAVPISSSSSPRSPITLPRTQSQPGRCPTTDI